MDNEAPKGNNFLILRGPKNKMGRGGPDYNLEFRCLCWSCSSLSGEYAHRPASPIWVYSDVYV